MRSFNTDANSMNRGNVDRRDRTTVEGMFELRSSDLLGLRLYARAALQACSDSLGGLSRRLKPTLRGVGLRGECCHLQQSIAHRPHRPWRLGRAISSPALVAIS